MTKMMMSPSSNGEAVSVQLAEAVTRAFPGLGSIQDVRKEIDDAFADMRDFYREEPDVVMRKVSGHGARLNELRVQIQRVEDHHRLWKQVRTRELEPAIEELSKQFTIASRLLAVRELDFKIASGQP